MDRKKVKSSNLKSVGHEDGTLEVEFMNGSVYQYPNVHPNTVRALLNAKSIGTHFNDNIRSRKHKKVKG